MANGVDGILQRIDSIQRRFMPKAVQPTGFTFQTVLADQLNDVSIAAGPEASAALRSDLLQTIDQMAGKYGVDAQLVAAVAENESSLNPNAVSPAGAIGVMQLMPQTAQSLGVGNMYDPRENIEGGTKYLKQLLTTFDGDVAKAVAAYNAGPQAVIEHNGIPPYRETQGYVQKVLQQYRAAQ